ncbi:MAG: hypothetical protein R3F43_05775 [bacterium]
MQLLVGAQVANPSTDALRPALAEGLRLGIDGGFMPNGQSVLRSQAYADLLVVPATGDRFTDFVWKNTASTAPPTTAPATGRAPVRRRRGGGSHRADPGRLRRLPAPALPPGGRRGERCAPIGPKVDKDAHVALPSGRRGGSGGPAGATPRRSA